MTYRKDMQEDKEPIIDTAKNIELCILNTEGMIGDIEPIPETMMEALQKGFPTATDLADYLVKNLEIPFREAHHLTGKIVLLAETKKTSLENLSLVDIQSVVPNADLKILEVLKIKNSVSSRTSYGGTAPKNVLKAIKNAKKRFLEE